MATGKAPAPIQAMVFRIAAPIEKASSPLGVRNLSAPVPTRIRPSRTEITGPFTSLRHGTRLSPERIITPTDQIASSTPRLWTKSIAMAPPPTQSCSTTGIAV